MSSINIEIAKEGKKLRNRVLYDLFEPAVDYPKLLQLLNGKQKAQEQFLSKNLYKTV